MFSMSGSEHFVPVDSDELLSRVSSKENGPDAAKDGQRKPILAENRASSTSEGPSTTKVPVDHAVTLKNQRAYVEDLDEMSGRRVPGTRRVATTRKKKKAKVSDRARTEGYWSPSEEDVTIKVTGEARVMVGGSQIDCANG